MASTSGTKELKRHWPVTTGLTAKTTKQEGRVMNLIYQKSIYPKRMKELLE